ncbi:hypothetical protein V6N13_033676 [Hibiscus sabdariffa]
MRALSWNVKGLGSSVKRLMIRKVLRQQRIEMVFLGSLTEPCCCGGDFNDVLSLEERRRCVGDLRTLAGFVSFVEEAGLLDIPAAGKVFIWYGAGSKVSRLDRFLVSLMWVEQFHVLEQFILKRGVSDHAPVRLSSGEVDWGPRPFRFLNCWLEKKGHVKLMESE